MHASIHSPAVSFSRIEHNRTEQRLTLFEALDPETPAVVTRSEYVEGVGIIHHLDTNTHR